MANLLKIVVKIVNKVIDFLF